MENVARQLRCSIVDAAQGIHAIVNTNMAEGIRIVSIRRGIDPRRFALLGFGGAAGLHITQVARLLEITRVVVPRLASVLSAWGMLATDLRYELVRTRVGDVRRIGAAAIRRLFREMEDEGRHRLGEPLGNVDFRRSVDMRYGEQVFEISVPLQGIRLTDADLIDQIVERFQRRHEELYTYSAPDQEVVLVNTRLAVVSRLPALPVEPIIELRGGPLSCGQRRAFFSGWIDAPTYRWDRLVAGTEINGPAIVESPTTTVAVQPGDNVRVTPHGWLDIKVS